ncbi:MAG: purine-binding chemotaxis protein CheW [Lachnospiraceae bacterium]|nr:purine-binding chemotaxis protein CheW [Lachnospiraceae bacterium]
MDALMAAESGENIQYIVIKLGGEQYGINIKYIDNIVRIPAITRVPKVDEYIKGVINIRGTIVPVMSLRLVMDMDDDEITDKSRIVIIKTESDDLIGVIVDEVYQVLTLNTNNIEKVAHDPNSAKASFITGVGKYEGGLVSILDLASIELDNIDGKANARKEDKKEGKKDNK